MRARVAALALAALAGVAVACSSGDSSDDAAAVAPTAEPAVEASDAVTEAGAAEAVAAAASSETVESAIAQATSDAAPPDLVPELPGGASGFSHFVFELVGDELITSLVEGPAGQQVRVPISYQQLKALAASGAEPPEELQMTREELTLLVAQLDAVRAATEKYADISVALADGYRQTTGEVPNMGAHFNHTGRILDGVFNPEEPEILMYSRDEDGQWELVATSYVLPRQTFGDDHPEGFAGPLDNWHVHYALCLGAGGVRTASASDCRANGGFFLSSYGWMIHAWVWTDNPLGTFSMWNPNIAPVMSDEGVRTTRTRAPEDLGDGSSFVVIENFEHSTLSISAGEAVVWANADGVVHTITSGSSGVADGGFDSGLVGPGQAYTQRFDTPGAYAFTCTLHPAMNGTVIVTESG